MADKMIENNQVSIMGEIVTPFSFSHEVFGEGFYMMEVDREAAQHSEDRIPVMVSERLIDVTQDYTGEYIGSMDSSGPTTGMKRRKTVWFFCICREVKFVEEEVDGAGQSDFSGWIYLQTAGLPENTAWKRNCRYCWQ